MTGNNETGRRMSEQHDYKAALEYFRTVQEALDEGCPADRRAVDAAVHALLCMDALMQEPSAGMTMVGCDAWKNYPTAVVTQFKAMRDHMIKEATDGR